MSSPDFQVEQEKRCVYIYGGVRRREQKNREGEGMRKQ